MINIKNADTKLLSIEKISFKSTDAVICDIKYITVKSLDNENIDSENRPSFILNDVDAFIIERNSFEENDEYK